MTGASTYMLALRLHSVVLRDRDNLHTGHGGKAPKSNTPIYIFISTHFFLYAAVFKNPACYSRDQ